MPLQPGRAVTPPRQPGSGQGLLSAVSEQPEQGSRPRHTSPPGAGTAAANTAGTGQ